jgi:hypothetical protein
MIRSAGRAWRKALGAGVIAGAVIAGTELPHVHAVDAPAWPRITVCLPAPQDAGGAVHGTCGQVRITLATAPWNDPTPHVVTGSMAG